jgi:hypothetical protein
MRAAEAVMSTWTSFSSKFFLRRVNQPNLLMDVISTALPEGWADLTDPASGNSTHAESGETAWESPNTLRQFDEQAAKQCRDCLVSTR